MTFRELKYDKNYIFHHEATHAGYVSRLLECDEIEAKPYSGRFGEGFTVHLPMYESTRYHRVLYYIKKKEG